MFFLVTGEDLFAFGDVFYCVETYLSLPLFPSLAFCFSSESEDGVGGGVGMYEKHAFGIHEWLILLASGEIHEPLSGRKGERL